MEWAPRFWAGCPHLILLLLIRITELAVYQNEVKQQLCTGEGSGQMVRGRVEPISRKCKNCGVIKEVVEARFNKGVCYACRRSLHAGGHGGQKQYPVRLKIFLSVSSLCCFMLVAYAVYYQSIVLPYGGRRTRSRLLEFKGLGITVPTLALLLFAFGLLAALIVVHRGSNEKSHERFIRNCLVSGVLFYWISIFFGSYR